MLSRSKVVPLSDGRLVDFDSVPVVSSVCVTWHKCASAKVQVTQPRRASQPTYICNVASQIVSATSARSMRWVSCGVWLSYVTYLTKQIATSSWYLASDRCQGKHLLYCFQSSGVCIDLL
eukprot:302108-Amphidinium_carterae.1